MNGSHQELLATLADRPLCTDAVIETMEAATQPTAGDLSDLSAAYYVRAQRQDRPVDLLQALDIADRALAASPSLPEASFNRALALEALGLSFDATEAWDRLQRDDHSQWGAEAGKRRDQLVRATTLTAATQWPLNAQRLPDAIRTGDTAAVEQLIRPFPAAAQRYVEEEVLFAWAEAAKQKQPRVADEQLRTARAMSEALLHATGDRYLLDDVELIEKATRARDPQTLDDLVRGHEALGKARVPARQTASEKNIDFYADAISALAHCGSPLQGGAVIKLANKITATDIHSMAPPTMLEPVVQRAKAHGYRDLLVQTHAARGYWLTFQSRYVESLTEYETSAEIAAQIGDREGVANARVRLADSFHVLGDQDRAWLESFGARRDFDRLVKAKDRHTFLGATASTVVSLGYPETALLYQSSAVRLIQDDLAHASSSHPAQIEELRYNLGVALRERAAIQLHLEHHEEEAKQDLDSAIRLAKDESKDEVRRRLLRARIAEVQGLALLRTDPAKAVAAFTEAIPLATIDEYRTNLSTLFAERAEAERLAGQKARAEQDLQSAISTINTEENDLLTSRKKGKFEEIWTPYFKRFQETYQSLIRQLAEEGKEADAFYYAERARAFEPLNLVVQKGALPEAFRVVTQASQAQRLLAIQDELPAGTYLVEYSVFSDRTYAWLISRDHFERLELPVGSAAIEHQRKALLAAARQRNIEAFEAALFEPYSDLVAAPLQAIAKLPTTPGVKRRLVFIPDGSIHGLPFSALRNGMTKRYVIEDYPIEIAGSATLYISSLVRDRELASAKSPMSALLVGDPAFDHDLEVAHGLPDLPAAKQEVETIRTFYPKVTVRTGPKATIPEFLARARESTVVHVAGHAIANAQAQASFRSLLLLAPSKNDTGVLDAETMLTDLRLEKTRLFVLSACSTAGGSPIGPEGLAPLVRPLIGAGVPAVVGTLWSVNDNLSRELLVEFHRHYSEGHDAAVALQLAQLDMLQDKAHRIFQSPLAWAPFEVIGHADSPFSATERNTRRELPWASF